MDAQLTSHTRLQGLWLAIGRLVWGLLTILALALFVVSVPAKLDDLARGYVGIGIVRNEAGEVVIASLPSELREDSGIQEGDVLVAIDGAPVSSDTAVADANVRLGGDVGTQVIVSVRNRDGVTQPYTLTRGRTRLDLSVNVDVFTRPYTLSRADDLTRILARLGLSLGAYAWYVVAFEVLQVSGFVLIGLFVFWRKSDDWLGLFSSLTLIMFGTSALTYVQPPWDIVAKLLYSLSILSTILCFYLFPDGRFVPRWTVGLGVYSVAWRALYLLPDAFHPTSWPFASGYFLGLALHAIGVVAQVYRYRYVSSPVQRQQTKWAVWGFAIAAAGTYGYILYKHVSISELYPWVVGSDVQLYLYLVFWQPLRTLSLLAAPAAVGISIMRWRLWDIDLVIKRSLVFGVLTVLLAALFAGSLLVISWVFQTLTGGQQYIVAVVASSLLFGAFFQPARRRLHEFVDRRFYGIQVSYAGPALSWPGTSNGFVHTQIGTYTDLQLVGRGGMAEVFQARDLAADRFVAIKVLLPHLVQQGGFRQRFEREAQVIDLLRHPNIVQVFDYGEVNGTYYIAMEYIAGPNMGDFLDRHGRLPLAQVCPIVRDIASALDYAHKHGLVHCDVKPSNVMLAPTTVADSRDISYRIVITDFGLAKILDESTRLTQSGVLGTLSYIAPEQIQSVADVDGRADVYALGVTTYQMLTGRLPFACHNPGALLIAHLTQPPPDPRDLVPDLPDGTVKALRCALSKRREERYATAGAFAHALADGPGG